MEINKYIIFLWNFIGIVLIRNENLTLDVISDKFSHFCIDVLLLYFHIIMGHSMRMSVNIKISTFVFYTDVTINLVRLYFGRKYLLLYIFNLHIRVSHNFATVLKLDTMPAGYRRTVNSYTDVQ